MRQSQQHWQQRAEETRIPGSCFSLGVTVDSQKCPSSPLEGGKGQVWNEIPQVFQSQSWHDQLWQFTFFRVLDCAEIVAQLSQADYSILQGWRTNYTDICKLMGKSEWRTVEELIQSLCELKPGHLPNKFSEQSWNILYNSYKDKTLFFLSVSLFPTGVACPVWIIPAESLKHNFHFCRDAFVNSI